MARVVDGLLVALVAGVLAVVVDVDNRWLAIPLSLAYETVALSRWGTTVGKRKMGLAVAAEDGGGRPSPLAALVRTAVLLGPGWVASDRIDTLGEWVPLLVVLANGYVIASRRDDRRGLHDLAAGTRPVVAVP